MNRKSKLSGFTLIELLVVVVIIATLAIVGAVFYQGVSNNSRDAKRKIDVEQIAKAYEMNFQNGQYFPLESEDFASGVPKDPTGADYNGFLTIPAPGFRICAALEKHSEDSCTIPSETCFCKTSQLGIFAQLPSSGPSPSADPSSSSEPSLPAYGVLVNNMDQTTPPAEIALRIQKAKDTGATWIRTDFWWYSVQPNLPSDQYDWTFLDRVVQEANNRGLKIIPILWGTPPWAKASGDPTAWDSYAVPRMDYWQNFVVSTVLRYKNTIHQWEIWNEPDLTSFWHGTPAQYALTLAGAQIAVKLADPEAEVWLGGLGQGGPNVVPNFLQQILSDPNYPAGNYYDVHNFHTNFLSMNDINAHIGGNLYWLQYYGLSKPFVVTENSYTSNPSYQPLTGYQDGEAGQARYITDSYNTILDQDARVIIWAMLKDDETTTSEYSQSGLVNFNYSSKEAFCTYSAMTGSPQCP